jgi:hypothetical protein
MRWSFDYGKERWIGTLSSSVIGRKRVSIFIAYLNKHRHRIVNYGYYQTESISIGSGAVESTIKQALLNKRMFLDVKPSVSRPKTSLKSATPLNKLADTSNFQGLNGKRAMFLRFSSSAVPTSMGNSQNESCKTGMYSTFDDSL